MRRLFGRAVLFILVLSMIAGVSACSKKEPEVDVSYDPADYVELCDYRNIKVKDEEITVPDEEVDDYIRELFDEFTEFTVITDRGAEKGDLVSINILGYDGDKLIDSLKAYYYSLVIGEGTLGLDFEDQIIGMKTDETKSFEISYDEDYPSDTIAGKTVKYEVKLNNIQEISEYEINDENVKLLFGDEYSTVDELKKVGRDYLLRYGYDIYREKLILEKVVDGCTVKGYPESLLEKYKDDMIAAYTAEAGSRGLESYLKSICGMSLDSFNEYVDMYCKSALKEEMIYSLIAEKENITVTDEEVNSFAEEYTEDYKQSFDFDASAEDLLLNLGEENVRQALVIRKVKSMICEWNV